MRAVPARSALFCGDLLHDLDFKVALGQQLLETGVFLLQRPQLFHVGRIQLAVALSPEIQRLLADTVLLGDLRDRRLVGLAENLDHLVFGESGLAHEAPRRSGAILSTFNWSENRPAGHPGILVPDKKVSRRARGSLVHLLNLKPFPDSLKRQIGLF